MEKNFERQSAANESLFQSYCNGIQKIAGTENAIASDFQISAELLGKRKKAWGHLFEKYSTMVSEIELNINTLQPDELINLPKVPEQRLPMRKPMSMVQYWVNTGNLLHLNCTNNIEHSDSGSSIVEEDHCESQQNNDSQSLTTKLTAEKHSNIADTSGNKNLTIVSSSDSSIDTAAYILANNNITKKAETIAIVEGSKVVNETHSPVKVNNNATEKADSIATVESSKVDTKTHSPVKLITPHIMEINENINRMSLARKNNHEKLELAAASFSQATFFKSCAEKITENIKIAKLNKMCEDKVNAKLKSQQSNICSIFFSDSDESISKIKDSTIQNDLTENNQNSTNVKRKKLYNRTDSPAEFTPVSEDNFSLHRSKIMLSRCLPLRRSEHPALETPTTSSRYLTRHRTTKFKRKINRRQCLSTISTSDENSENQKLLDPNQNNSNSRFLNNSQIQSTEKNHTQTGSKENSNTNLILSQNRSDDDIHVEKSNLENSINKGSSLDSSSKLLKNKLKSCKIVVKKLPYKYSLNSSKNSIERKNLPASVQSKKIADVNKNLRNYTSNIDPINNAKGLSESTCYVKANNTKTFADIFSSRAIEMKSSCAMSSNYSSSNIYSSENIPAKRSEKKHNKSLYKEKSKYVIADSSSDESDMIVTNAKNKYVSKSRKSKKLASKPFPDDECSNVSNEDSSQSCLNIQKDNSFSQESRHEVPSRDRKNNKKKIKSPLDTLSSSEEEISTPIKENNQTVNSANISNQTIGSKRAMLSESKTTSNSIWNCQVLVNRIEEINDKVDVNKKLSEVAITNSKTKSSEKMRNEREPRVRDKSFDSDNSGDVDTLSNSVSSKKKIGKISAQSNTENSLNIQSNKSPTKQTQRRDKFQRIQDSTKVKTTIIQNTSTKKRKSLEIDVSSEEECIMPLKKKE